MTSKQSTATTTDAGIAAPSAAMSILAWFTLSAVVMVLPNVFGSGMAALSFAIASACVALFAVGAAIGQLNSRGAMHSGARLLLIGGAAVLLVFVLGHLAGASMAG